MVNIRKIAYDTFYNYVKNLKLMGPKPDKNQVNKRGKSYPRPKYNNDKIPSKIGIYFIYNKNKKIIYVGKAKNLRKRIAIHISPASDYPLYSGYPHCNSNVPSDIIEYVSYILCNDEMDATFLEQLFIYLLNPIFNRHPLEKYRRRRKNAKITTSQR